MFNRKYRKALALQGLFLCLGVSAQTIIIEKPGRNEPLQDQQEFVISTFGGVPERVDFYLNGRLVLARREAPYTFTIRWNTRYKNTVRVVAHFPGEEPVSITRDYQEIQVDVEEEIEVFQFFPFLDRPLGDGWRVTSKGKPTTPQAFEPATRFPLELIIALDTSGSMMFNFDELEKPVRGLIEWCKARNFPLTFLIFDRKPNLVRLENLPPSLKDLYRERPSSVVWDTIATASGLFKESPRRVLMIISDGGDQGSRHNPETASDYLRKSGAALIWVSPENLPNKELSKLCKNSGGFSVYTGGRDPWPGIIYLLDKQYHLLAPEAAWPVDIKLKKGRIWFPRWEN
ncbi:MAG: hypothetical protein QNK37_37480 [Acidobacteriota bacterium]|nr:hypothetical protein [Acidobacteriota bacterium]